MGFIDHWRSSKLVPFESLGVVYYSPSIVTIALSCIIQFRDKARYWSQIVILFIPPAFGAPVGESPSEYCHGKTRIVGLPDGEENFFKDMYDRLHTISACDGQTDRQTNRQTSFHSIVRAMHTRRAVKTGTSPYYWPYLTGVISVAISTGMVFPCIHCYDVVDHDFM